LRDAITSKVAMGNRLPLGSAFARAATLLGHRLDDDDLTPRVLAALEDDGPDARPVPRARRFGAFGTGAPARFVPGRGGDDVAPSSAAMGAA
jgi:hypothetical protein